MFKLKYPYLQLFKKISNFKTQNFVHIIKNAGIKSKSLNYLIFPKKEALDSDRNFLKSFNLKTLLNILTLAILKVQLVKHLTK